MSNADRSYDLVGKGRSNGDLTEFHTGNVPLDVSARTAAHGLDRPTMHLWLPPSNALAVYVGSLECSKEMLYPAVLTWEFYLGGRGRLDPAVLFQRKTCIASTSAQAQRLGLLVSFEGPLFHQVLLVTRLGTTVGGVAQTGHVRGTLDVTPAMTGRIGGLRVSVGTAVG